MEKQLVIFELAGEFFGIDIATVESIIKMQNITPIPQAPAFMKGITSFRSSILPVLDLKKRFSLKPMDRTSETRIVIVTLDSLKIGMIVDSVSEVLTIEESMIEPTPSVVSTVDTQFISGISRIDQQMVILLDPTKLLSEKEQQTALLLLN